MNPTSVPVIPPQPNQAEYPASDLQTLASFPSTQAYEATFGVLPPKYDSARPIQSWFDTTPQSLFSPYPYVTIALDPNGNPVETPQVIPGVWAVTPNIPTQTDTVPAATPSLAPPVRGLLPNERLFVNQDGGGPGVATPWILRTDLQGTLPAQYTQSDKAIIARLGAYLAKEGA